MIRYRSTPLVMIAPMCALWFVLLTGCTTSADESLMRVREIKYVADTLFAEQMRRFVGVADSVVLKKHSLQGLIIRNTYADWIRNNGGEYDAEGVLIGGQVNLVLMMQTLEVKHEDDRKLRESRASWEQAREIVLVSIDAYVQANERTYDSEDDAYEAKKSAQVALTQALEAMGVLTAVAIGALAG